MACVFFYNSLSCIENLYTDVLVSMFHTKFDALSPWLLDFSNCLKLTFFLANLDQLKLLEAHNPLTLEIRSAAVSASGDEISISST